MRRARSPRTSWLNRTFVPTTYRSWSYAHSIRTDHGNRPVP
jgi:hypothetical protein